MNRVVVPGRANLIGEHTDYNAGVALPFAIDLRVEVTATTSGQRAVCVEAEDFGRWCDGDAAVEPFARQAQAVVNALRPGSHHLDVRSTIPPGAGLSSSAAYVGALALALGATGSLYEVARLVQRCEREAGSDVGLLDQLATLGARRGHALLIDFARDAVEDVPWPEALHCTVVHSGVARTLATTAYAQRRRECAAASAALGGFAGADAQRVASLEDPVLRARARHVVSENERVRHTAAALRLGDLAEVGHLVSESHRSLRDDFEVSTPEIDRLVEQLATTSGVFGARMVGGGFGGCVLVVHDRDVDVRSETRRSWAVRPSAGAFELLGRER